MKRALKLLYILVTLSVGWSLPVIEFQFGIQQEFVSEISLQLICLFLLAILAFPIGALAVFFLVALMLNGILGGWEALVILTPIMAVLGYLQWFWIFPRLYRRKSDIPAIF